MCQPLDDLVSHLPFQTHGYEFQSVLGRGTFACVLKAVRIDSGHTFAAKIMCCNSHNIKMNEIMRSELDCLISLLHPNIIKIYDRFSERNFMFLILEYCNRGSLEDFIKDRGNISEQEKLVLMRQLLSAVHYCYSQGIAHRDIKPANILIADNGAVKLGDFGLGIQMGQEETISEFSGSFLFKAPELIRKEEHDPFKADIWSLGVTFYYLVTGTYPWGKTKGTIAQRIIAGRYKFPPGTPTACIQIIKQMLVVDPSQRATAEHLLSDPFILTARNPNVSIHLNDLKRYPMCFNTRISIRNARRASTLSLNGANVIRRNREDRMTNLNGTVFSVKSHSPIPFNK